MKTYLAEYRGMVIEGQMIVTDVNKESACRSALNKINEMGLYKRNEDFSVRNLREIDLTQKGVVVIYDGDM